MHNIFLHQLLLCNQVPTLVWCPGRHTDVSAHWWVCCTWLFHCIHDWKHWLTAQSCCPTHFTVILLEAWFEVFRYFSFVVLIFCTLRTVWFKMFGVVVAFHHSSHWPAVSLRILHTVLWLFSDTMSKYFLDDWFLCAYCQHWPSFLCMASRCHSTLSTHLWQQASKIQPLAQKNDKWGVVIPMCHSQTIPSGCTETFGSLDQSLPIESVGAHETESEWGIIIRSHFYLT